MASLGNLYSKNILVRLTNSKSSEDKFKSINITVDYQITGTLQSHKTELIIKLTDENDPFFLYSLYMTEEDYQNLKLQQGLLVDFGAFGQRFIDLLCACEKDEKSDNPKFQLQLFSKDPLPFDHTNANLNIIEINPFKHLCHLSLTFTPGNDSDVKKYLANCLKILKEDYTKLTRLFDETKNQLNQKLETTQQLLSQKTIELEKTKIELDSQTEKLLTKHMQELNFERDKSIQNQYANQQKFEKEKKELELNLMKTIKQLEQRLNELEITNKDLLEKKFLNESQLQELKIKYASIQDDFNTVKIELNASRKENTNLDSELHSNEKLNNQLKTRIATLEQELKDKADAFNKTNQVLVNEQVQHKQVDDLLKEKTNELKKKQAEINHYVEEFKKGNEIVIKLQNREKNLASQLKLKTRILTEQEKVMKDKEKTIEELKTNLKESLDKIELLKEEVQDLKNSVQKKNSELEEAAKLLKRDENIISWLNKQITENNIGLNNSNKVNNLEGTLNQFRPYGTLQVTNGNYGTAGNLTQPSTSTLNGGTNDFDNKRCLINLQTNNYQKSAISSGSSSSFQNETLKENQDFDLPTVNHRPLELNKISNGSGKLDPKYFQNHSPQSLITTGNNNNHIDSLMKNTQNLNLKNTMNTITQSKPNHIQPSSYSSTNSIRINKQILNQNQIFNSAGISTAAQQQSDIISSKSSPSLASAYFPPN